MQTHVVDANKTQLADAYKLGRASRARRARVLEEREFAEKRAGEQRFVSLAAQTAALNSAICFAKLAARRLPCTK